MKWLNQGVPQKRQLLARAVHQEGDEQHVVTVHRGAGGGARALAASNYGRDEWWVLLDPTEGGPSL